MALLSACTDDKDGSTTAGGGSTGATSSTTSSGVTGGSTATATGGTPSGTGGSVGATGGSVTGGSIRTTGSGSGGSVLGTGGAATGGSRASSSGGSSTGDGGSIGVGGATESSSLGGQGGRSGAGGQTGTGGRAAGGSGGSRVAGGATGGSAIGGQGSLGGAGGQTGTGGGGGAVAGTACASTLAAVTDYSAAGPFATTTESNTGPDGKCVIYRPKTLGENGFMHAPIVFGPGIGMQASQLSGLLLSFASHGFVVIGTGVLNGGPNDPANKSAMTNALDWIIKQNTQAGTYQGKLAVKCAVSMGYSVGGTAAVEVGGHEAVATTVSIHGHTATSAMHGPLLQTSGDKDTVGRPMQQKTFDQSKVQTFFGVVSGADHGYIQSNNGGVERVAIIAWMRYWINNDTGAKRYFWGDDCVLCTSPWMDPQRKNWQ
jgi:hypothetical protein